MAFLQSGQNALALLSYPQVQNYVRFQQHFPVYVDHKESQERRQNKHLTESNGHWKKNIFIYLFFLEFLTLGYAI